MAYASVSDFKSKLKLGGARPSLFEVHIASSPSGVTIPVDHRTKCFTTEIPGLTVTPIEKLFFGRTVKIPGEMTFDTLSTTFYNNEKFDIRRALEDWTDVINDPDSNEGVSGSPATYSGKIELIHYVKDGKKGMTYVFVDCWPSEVAAIELSYDETGDMESFAVTWSYDYYQIIAGTITGQATDGTQV